MDNRAGFDCGRGSGGGGGMMLVEKTTGENWDNCNRTTIKKYFRIFQELNNMTHD